MQKKKKNMVEDPEMAVLVVKYGGDRIMVWGNFTLERAEYKGNPEGENLRGSKIFLDLESWRFILNIQLELQWDVFLQTYC